MLKGLVTAAIRFYRRYVSGLKRAPSCRFLPTCSEYAIEALETWGMWIGGGKVLWRLLRCNPLCRGGYDPVDGSGTAGRCSAHAIRRAFNRVGDMPVDLVQDRQL